MKKYNAVSCLSDGPQNVADILTKLYSIAKVWGVTFDVKYISIARKSKVEQYQVTDGFAFEGLKKVTHLPVKEPAIWYAAIEVSDADAKKIGDSMCIADVVISSYPARHLKFKSI